MKQENLEILLSDIANKQSEILQYQKGIAKAVRNNTEAIEYLKDILYNKEVVVPPPDLSGVDQKMYELVKIQKTYSAQIQNEAKQLLLSYTANFKRHMRAGFMGFLMFALMLSVVIAGAYIIRENSKYKSAIEYLKKAHPEQSLYFDDILEMTKNKKSREILQQTVKSNKHDK